MPSTYNVEDFGNRLVSFESLVSALKKDTPEDLNKFGVSPDLLQDADETLKLVKTLDEEQEKLKALQKSKTADLNSAGSKMDKMYFRFKRKLKAEVKQELWKKYGIEDKH